jgi:fructokinase
MTDTTGTPGSVLVAGESLVDVVVGPDGQTLEAAPGGAPLNIAVGLARLGVPTHLLTSFGRDAHGDRLDAHLRDSGVRLQPGSRAAARTSVARALLDADQQATYEFDLAFDPPCPALPADCAAVHVGSLGTVTAPGAEGVLDLAARARAAGLVVSYDPNVRPTVLGDVADAWQQVRRLAAGAAVVKLSDQDAAHLLPGWPADAVLDELLEGEHTRLAVLTLGAEGLRLATAGQRVEVPAPAVGVVDTVGAGDACMAALLASLRARGRLTVPSLDTLGRADLEAVGGVAARVAALTCSRRGADPPRLRDLDDDALGARRR